MAMLSPASRTPFATSGMSDALQVIDTTKPKARLQKSDSKLGKWLSHVHERLVMKLVCCAPASVVLEVEFEDEDFCRPEDTEIKKIEPAASSFRDLLLKKQKSASIVPVLKGSRRVDSDRDIPTNEELEQLPIDLSFINDTDAPIPPRTPRHADLVNRAQQLSAFREQHSARLIQRRWRTSHTDDAAEHTDLESDAEKTDLETDTEQANGGSRSNKPRRRRIRKHRGRKKRSNH